MSNKNLIKIILNTVLGLILIWIWLKFVNLPQILATISQVKPVFLIPTFVFMFLSPLIRAYRLKVFLKPVAEVGFKDLVFLNGVAMMLNFFIPIRAGEVAKGVYLNNRYGLSLGKSVVWIFIDRFVDFLVILLVSSLLLFNLSTRLPVEVPLTLLFIFIGAFSATMFMVFLSHWTRNLFKVVSLLMIINPIKLKFRKVFEFFLDTFAVLNRNSQDLLVLFGLTVLAYAADGAIFYFIFMGLGSPQAFIRMYLAQLLSALAYLIPAAPGYIGSAEASGLAILSGVLGIEANLASAMTVLFHVLSAIFILVFGLISLYGLKLNLNEVFKRTQAG